MWKARSFKHSKTTSNVLVFITNEQVKLISYMVDFTLGIRYVPLKERRVAAVTLKGAHSMFDRIRDGLGRTPFQLYGSTLLHHGAAKGTSFGIR